MKEEAPKSYRLMTGATDCTVEKIDPHGRTTIYLKRQKLGKKLAFKITASCFSFTNGALAMWYQRAVYE